MQRVIPTHTFSQIFDHYLDPEQQKKIVDQTDPGGIWIDKTTGKLKNQPALISTTGAVVGGIFSVLGGLFLNLVSFQLIPLRVHLISRHSTLTSLMGGSFALIGTLCGLYVVFTNARAGQDKQAFDAHRAPFMRTYISKAMAAQDPTKALIVAGNGFLYFYHQSKEDLRIPSKLITQSVDQWKTKKQISSDSITYMDEKAVRDLFKNQRP